MLCLGGSAPDTVVGLTAPCAPAPTLQLGNVGSRPYRGPHRIAGPRAPRPHDPPLGTVSVNVDCDRSARAGWYNGSMSQRYCGACLWITRYVSDRILYSIRLRTGSQWSLINVGVIWSRRIVFVIIHAHVFCSRCILLVTDAGKPYGTALQ